MLLAIYNNDSDIAKGSKHSIDRMIYSDIRSEEKKLILKQIQKDDIFLMKIINKEKINRSDSNITNNYYFFKEAIDKEPTLIEKIMNGLNRLRCVEIKIDSNDHPQLVFESLNATGKKLTEADKIRNYVLMDPNQEKLYQNYWAKIEDNCLQNMDHTQVSKFIKLFLTIEDILHLTKPVKEDDVYEHFKQYLYNRNNEDILSLLLEYSLLYQSIITSIRKDNNQQIQDILRHILDLKITSLDTIMLYILRIENQNKISTQSAYEMIFLLENYVIRRLSCSLATAGLTHFLFSIIKKLVLLNSEEEILDVFKRSLVNGSESARFHKDQEVIESMKTKRMYGGQVSFFSRVVLSLLENISSKELINIDSISIEYIMPQRLTSTWKENLGE